MKNLLSVLFLLTLFYDLNANKNNILNFSLGFGPNSLEQHLATTRLIDLSIINKRNVFTFHVSKQFQYAFFSERPSDYIGDISLLYGKTLFTKNNISSFLTIKAGLGWLSKTVYKSAGEPNPEQFKGYSSDCLGFPFEISFVKRIWGAFGLSFSTYVNINKIRSFRSAVMSIYFAKFDSICEPGNYTKSEYLSGFEVNIMQAYIAGVFNSLDLKIGYIHSRMLKGFDTEIQVYFNDYSNYQNYGYLKVSLNFRKFLSQENEGFNYFFGLGFRDFNSENKNTKLIEFSGGFGYKQYISENLYFSSYLTLSKPFIGNIKFINDKMKNDYLGIIFDIDLFKFGINLF